MHIYMMTRGLKDRVDNFINDLQAQYFHYGKESVMPCLTQLQVRPIQLWEIVFPEEHLPVVSKLLFGNSLFQDPRLWGIRKLLGADKFPEMDLSTLNAPFVRKEFVSTYPIGIRKDKIFASHNPGSAEL